MKMRNPLAPEKATKPVSTASASSTKKAKKANKMTATTGNGAPAYEHTMDHCLEFFSKCGSFNAQKYYNHGEDSIKLFKDAWYQNPEVALKLLFWSRDARGGAGQRKLFRECMHWLGDEETEWVVANIELIPEHGRWDDLKSLYGTEAQDAACDLWALALNSDTPATPLAAKWADRQDKVLREHMKLSPKAYRKLVVGKTGAIVESNMCDNDWENINFNHIPSVAMTRYRKAFAKHQPERFTKFCEDLKSTKNVNASVLFPHDLIRMVRSNPSDWDKSDFKSLVDTMFENMPNYIADPDTRIMPICDFSGSMGSSIGGSITCMDVSHGLALYCSDRLGKDNPFYRKFMPFSSDSHIVSWDKMSLVDTFNLSEVKCGYMGSTNIAGVLDKLYESAKLWRVKDEDMINTLVIISDMQWDSSVKNSNEDVIETRMKKWEAAGYARPRIVFWNVNAYAGTPATKKTKNVALVSGFSPSVLKNALGANKSPLDVMFETIEKYVIRKPE